MPYLDDCVSKASTAAGGWFIDAPATCNVGSVLSPAAIALVGHRRISGTSSKCISDGSNRRISGSNSKCISDGSNRRISGGSGINVSVAAATNVSVAAVA